MAGPPKVANNRRAFLGLWSSEGAVKGMELVSKEPYFREGTPFAGYS